MKAPRGATLAIAFALFAVTGANGARAGEADPLLVIAHRGASGYLPEHTLPAYAAAFFLGADFIETDVLMTRDQVLVALHDIRLDFNTNVKEVFPDRVRKDGHWYAADLDFAEIRRLAVHGRKPQRYRQASTAFRVPSFEEILELVAELNRLSGRRVGIYAETKFSAFHARNGLPLEEAMLAMLARFGYDGPDDPIFVESFDPASLVKLRSALGTKLRLVQLMNTTATYNEMLTEAGLERIASYAAGVGLKKELFSRDPGLVARAKKHGLFVHAFSYRADGVPDGYTSFDEEVRRAFVDEGVSGVFADHPEQAIRVRDSLTAVAD